MKRQRVALFEVLTSRRADTEFVAVAVLHAGDKARPDTAVAAVQRVASWSPTVGIAKHGDFAGVRCPHGNPRPRHAIDFVEMDSQSSIQYALGFSRHRHIAIGWFGKRSRHGAWARRAILTAGAAEPVESYQSASGLAISSKSLK